MESEKLSDGEILDSSNSSPGSTSNDCLTPKEISASEEWSSPPAQKKNKPSDQLNHFSQPALYGVKGKKSYNKKQRKKMRQQVEKMEREKKRVLTMRAGEEWLPNILKGLIALNRGESLAIETHKVKTINFQNLVSLLILGSFPTHSSTSPGFQFIPEPIPDFQSIPGLDGLRQNRVVVVWMAMVSEEFFRSSKKHFPKLKSLIPSLEFALEHPGSSRFVKLGLETFLVKASNDDPPKPNAPVVATASSHQPTMAAYVFSQDELLSHGFPVPSTSNSAATASSISCYLQLAEWPDKEPRSVIEEREGVKMFAIDCEMVETEGVSSELARVSIVNESHVCIYDSLVKPDKPITDYRTKYSGINEKMLQNVTVRLSDVQKKLSELIPPEAILIGHSLDNDFHALKFCHPFVIDTTCIFTPKATPTNKPSLRRLAKELLEIEIQKGTGAGGHDSVEDAVTCMKLVQLKLNSDSDCTIAFNESGSAPSIFTEYRTQGKSTGIVDRRGVVAHFGRGASYSCDVDTDTDCVDKAQGIIPQCDFTFLQFHEMESFFKGNPTYRSELEVANAMDDNVLGLVEKCPEGTLLFVVCGSSDIREVRRLQRDEFADPWELKKAVMTARTGTAIAFVVN